VQLVFSDLRQYKSVWLSCLLWKSLGFVALSLRSLSIFLQSEPLTAESDPFDDGRIGVNIWSVTEEFRGDSSDNTLQH
jgi:hypothetical protein